MNQPAPILGVFWDAAAESGSSPTEDGFYPEYLQISDVQTLISALLCVYFASSLDPLFDIHA